MEPGANLSSFILELTYTLNHSSRLIEDMGLNKSLSDHQLSVLTMNLSSPTSKGEGFLFILQKIYITRTEE